MFGQNLSNMSLAPRFLWYLFAVYGLTIYQGKFSTFNFHKSKTLSHKMSMCHNDLSNYVIRTKNNYLLALNWTRFRLPPSDLTCLGYLPFSKNTNSATCCLYYILSSSKSWLSISTTMAVWTTSMRRRLCYTRVVHTSIVSSPRQSLP